MHRDDRNCGHQHPVRDSARRRPDGTPIQAVGAISQTIAAASARTRLRVDEDALERRARHLHARSSFDCWNALSDTDQELWRHMARLDLVG